MDVRCGVEGRRMINVHKDEGKSTGNNKAMEDICPMSEVGKKGGGERGDGGRECHAIATLDATVRSRSSFSLFISNA
jgi:hypothetical protein